MLRRAMRSGLLAMLLAASQPLAAAGPALEPAPGVDPAAAREARSNAAMDQMIRADVNKDGVVTREEVERLDNRLARRFKAADADRDGRLTLPEFERLRELSSGATRGAGHQGRTSGGGR